MCFGQRLPTRGRYLLIFKGHISLVGGHSTATISLLSNRKLENYQQQNKAQSVVFYSSP
jgi:hypothetical protein